MRGILGACTVLCGVLGVQEAAASVQIAIDLSSQTMHVRSESGNYDWRVSTARSGYRTPRGTYRPYQLVRMHYSRKYHMSPMPYSIFFAGGYAIHGTYSTGSLGRPASHGCIRLAPGNAALLYHMVQAEGARISIKGRRHAPASLTPPGTGNITTRLPMRQQGMRQSQSGPGRPILSSDPSRNGPRGRNSPNAVIGRGPRAPPELNFRWPRLHF